MNNIEITNITVKVVMNEQHKLFPEQEKQLNEYFTAEWKILPIPKEGLKLVEIVGLLDKIKRNNPDTILVFASPIPAMMKQASKCHLDFYVFHNDRREKKELPNGKIIQVVAPTGWMIV